MIIEPCCYSKQLARVIHECEIGGDGCAHFFSFSDWSLQELLPWLCRAVPGGDVTLSLVRLHPATVSTLTSILAEEVVVDACMGQIAPLVASLTLYVQPQPSTETYDRNADIRAQLQPYIDTGRLAIVEDSIAFRCITISNARHHWVIQGSINQERMSATQMYTITTLPQAYQEVMEVLRAKRHVRRLQRRGEQP